MIGQWHQDEARGQDGGLLLQSTFWAMQVNLPPVDAWVHEQEPFWANEARKLTGATTIPKGSMPDVLNYDMIHQMTGSIPSHSSKQFMMHGIRNLATRSQKGPLCLSWRGTLGIS